MSLRGLVEPVNQGDEGILHGRVWKLLGAHTLLELVRRSYGDEFAPVNKTDPIAVFRFIHEMRCYQNCDPFFY